MLSITHDLELALSVAHRVAVFYAGETIEEAYAADFAGNGLRHPFYPGAVGTPCPSGDSAPFQALSLIPGKGTDRMSLFGPVSPSWTRMRGGDRFPFVRGLAEGFAACILIRRKPYDFRS